MSERKQNISKFLLILLVVISFICFSFRPVTNDISAIEPISQITLQGETTNETKQSTEQIHNQQSLQTTTEESQEEPSTNQEESETSSGETNPNRIQQPLANANGSENASGESENPLISDDAGVIEIVDHADSEQAYFTTNLTNGMIVTEPKYNVIITQLSDLTVEEMKITLNGEVLDNFKGELLFTEGLNDVTLTMYYKKDTGEQLVVKQNYDITLNTKDIIIQTSIIEQAVEEEQYRFTASASLAGKNIPIKAKLNGEEIKPQAGFSYSVILKKGENDITFSATNGDKEATSKYTVLLEKEQGKLHFETDLVNQKVSTSIFDFYVRALYGDENIDYKISLNGELLHKNEKYTVKLQNGTNKIQLQATYKNEKLTSNYQIIYTDPNAPNVEEKDELAPTIKTDLKNGTHVKGLIKTINVWPTAADGTRIRGKNVAVKVNGIGVPFVWDDSEKTSYKLTLKDGKNTIEIRVWDHDGRVSKETYELTAKDLDNQVIGQATISVEASVLGIPYLIPPTKVDIHQGEKGSYIIDQLLRKYGFKYDHTGTLENNFYLSTLKKPNMLLNLQIPDDLWLLVEESSTRANREEYDPHSLGEFDFANGSGWMFSINGDYPNYGFSDAYFLDGDVVRIRYTLHYGKDIAGFGGMGGGSGSNWDKEW